MNKAQRKAKLMARLFDAVILGEEIIGANGDHKGHRVVFLYFGQPDDEDFWFKWHFRSKRRWPKSQYLRAQPSEMMAFVEKNFR